MSDRQIYSLSNPSTELAAIDFKALDLTGTTEMPSAKISSLDDAVMRLNKAFEQSLLEGASQEWFTFPSVRRSLGLQLRLLGDEKRNFGNVSFLTHLMEVTDWVYNCPELAKFPKETRAFVPTNHDLEDISKKFGVQPLFVRNYFMGFLRADPTQKPYIAQSLYLMMDPPTIEGKQRMEVQIARIPSMDEVALYTRFADKYRTYRRDLHNMQTMDPTTGKPFLQFRSLAQAAVYRDKMLSKQDVVFALPIDPKYHLEWVALRSEINVEIEDQLIKAGLVAPSRFRASESRPWQRALTGLPMRFAGTANKIGVYFSRLML